MRLILPLILALLGASAGLGGGFFLRPGPETSAAPSESHGNGLPTDAAGAMASHGDEGAGGTGHDAPDEVAAGTAHGNPSGDPTAGDQDATAADSEFTKLNNQFVVPVLHDGQVRSMVILSLSLETPIGRREVIFAREPKIRDTFLQVLFDHANTGGFDGEFTSGHNMDILRGELRRSAKQLLGADVHDVLVTDIARQDFG